MSFEIVMKNSAADFKKELQNLGFKFNKNDEVKLRMKEETRLMYFV